MPYNQHQQYRLKHQAHETAATISQDKTGALVVSSDSLDLSDAGTVTMPTAQPVLTRITETVAYDDFTDGGGASGTFTLTEGTVPIGATVQRAVLTALTGFTGDTSAVLTVGDGTDADRYNTGTPSVFTTAANGLDLGAPSGTAYHAAAKSIILTVTSNASFASVSAGSLTIEFYYYT